MRTVWHLPYRPMVMRPAGSSPMVMSKYTFLVTGEAAAACNQTAQIKYAACGDKGEIITHGDDVNVDTVTVTSPWL